MSSAPKRHTLAEAQASIAEGYPPTAERLTELVAWLASQNSAGFSEIAEFLQSLGKVVVPYVKAALSESDGLGEWHSALLFTQVSHWPREWLVEIKEELNDLAWYGSAQWGVDEDAALLLAKNKLGDRDNLRLLVERKRKNCYSRLKKLDEIEQYLQSTELGENPVSGPWIA